jgi:NAD+ kinase
MRFTLLHNEHELFKFQNLIGDGFVIATPIGSTGYNESAGGFVLPRKMKAFVVTLRYPVGLYTKRQRSKIIPKWSELRFQFTRPDKAIMIIDSSSMKLKKYDEVLLEPSQLTFNVVRIKNMEETLREKQSRRMAWFKRNQSE